MITLLLIAGGGCLLHRWWVHADAHIGDALDGLRPPTTQADMELAA